MCFVKGGDIVVLNQEQLLAKVSSGSIFNIKGEDCIDIVLIKSKENFLFAVESQKLEFYSAITFKKQDSWDYYFAGSLLGCCRNKEGSNILIWD